jgi:phosphatidylserine/phosphatidylglycerophosphate/cardiolipin synthase-like enzyme
VRWLCSVLAATIAFHPALLKADEFCEPAGTDCRARLLAYIGHETVRLDVGTEEITDSTIADAVIARFRAKVPVRMIVEPRRTSVEPANGVMLNKLKAAGIPMRYKHTGDIVHWKMMIFAGQHTVQFGAAQYTKSYLVPVQPYVNFTQDPIYFSTNVAVVNSFERKFDDAWVDATNFANFGNSATVGRAYPSYSIDASMNFVPAQNFGTRSKARYDAETTRIDVIMYKITEATHADAIIRARQRGVPVRLITEPTRYRNPDNVWQAYFLDRMYAAGVSIRDRAHQGFLHQKTTLLYSQGLAVFGSSNWTTASNGTQYEHNYFTTGSAFFEWFRKVFVRKWNSSTETKAFVPLPPDKPVYVTPANTAGGQPTTVVLSWKPGPWAHRADVYFGTSSTPPLAMKDVTLSPNTTKKLTVSNLEPARSYFWKIVSKTMAGKTAAGPVWSFATQ